MEASFISMRKSETPSYAKSSYGSDCVPAKVINRKVLAKSMSPFQVSFYMHSHKHKANVAYCLNRLANFLSNSYSYVSESSFLTYN